MCEANCGRRYAGVYVEDSIPDAVVRETSGEVRVRGAELVRTEFHASSGGWTAGGTFPAVIDVGDAVPANPHRRWTTLIDRSAIEGRYELGRLHAIPVHERNGQGAEVGRAQGRERVCQDV